MNKIESNFSAPDLSSSRMPPTGGHSQLNTSIKGESSMNALTRTLTILLSLSFLSLYALGPKTLAGQGAKFSANDIVGKWEGGVTVGDNSMGLKLELKNEG